MDLFLEIIKGIILLFVSLVVFVALVAEGSNTTYKVIKNTACTNSCGQTEAFLKCKEMDVEEFLQRVMVK